MKPAFPVRILYKVEYAHLGHTCVSYFVADCQADALNAITATDAYQLGQIENIKVTSLRAVNVV